MTRARPHTLTRVATLFTLLGVKDRTDRLRLCSDHAGRYLTTSSDLSEVEALRLVARLEGLPDGVGLRRRLAELVADEENRAALDAQPALVCSRRGKPPTEGDLAKARAFGDWLKQAGPPPTRKQALGCPIEEGTAMSCPFPVADCCMTMGPSSAQLGVDLGPEPDDVVIVQVEGQLSLLEP